MDITGEVEDDDLEDEGPGLSKAQKTDENQRVPVDLSTFNVKGDNRDINDNQ